MNSIPEPHADRPQEPILSEAKGYAPQRARWPGVLAVAVLLAAAVGGVLVTGHEEKRATAPPDRSVQAPQPQAEPQSPQPSADTRVAQPGGSTAPNQP